MPQSLSARCFPSASALNPLSWALAAKEFLHIFSGQGWEEGEVGFSHQTTMCCGSHSGPWPFYINGDSQGSWGSGGRQECKTENLKEQHTRYVRACCKGGPARPECLSLTGEASGKIGEGASVPRKFCGRCFWGGGDDPSTSREGIRGLSFLS